MGTNSFSGPVYRDPFRIASARVTSNVAILPLANLHAVDTGSGVYVPSTDATLTNRIDQQPGMFHMGPGDRLEFFVGGEDTANQTAFALVTRIDAVHNSAGVPVAFVERFLALATFSLSTTDLAATDALVVGITEIEEDDHLPDIVALGASTAGVEIISPGSERPCAVVIAQARQAEYMRVQTYRGTAAECWILARRLQGDARPVVR
jgi:hypothetical protein